MFNVDPPLRWGFFMPNKALSTTNAAPKPYNKLQLYLNPTQIVITWVNSPSVSGCLQKQKISGFWEPETEFEIFGRDWGMDTVDS